MVVCVFFPMFEGQSAEFYMHVFFDKEFIKIRIDLDKDKH